MNEYWVTVPHQAEPVVVFADAWALTDRALKFSGGSNGKALALFNNNGGWLNFIKMDRIDSLGD